MTARRLLVVPLLSPLLAVLLVAALNPRPQLAFRVLTWTTPQAPLGLWLGGGALGGAALSGVGTALALAGGKGATPRARRRVTTTRSARAWQEGARGSDGGWPQEPWERMDEQGSRSQDSWRERAPSPSVVPPRAPGDPAPTLDVPFRILRRPSASEGQGGGLKDAVRWSPLERDREPVPVAVEDDWGREGSGDDW